MFAGVRACLCVSHSMCVCVSAACLFVHRPPPPVQVCLPPPPPSLVEVLFPGPGPYHDVTTVVTFGCDPFASRFDIAEGRGGGPVSAGLAVATLVPTLVSKAASAAATGLVSFAKSWWGGGHTHTRKGRPPSAMGLRPWGGDRVCACG